MGQVTVSSAQGRKQIHQGVSIVADKDVFLYSDRYKNYIEFTPTFYLYHLFIQIQIKSFITK